MINLNWQTVKGLEVLENDFVVQDYMPAKNVITEEILIGRTDMNPVDTHQWGQIKDADVPDVYAKKAFVKSYFTVAIYMLKRVGNLSLAPNKSYNQTIDISHTSSLRKSETSSLRIENTVEATGNAEFGSLREMLTTSYSIDKMEEYYTEDRKTKTQIINYDSVPYARELVFWDFVKIIALYREDKKGNIKLLAYNDFLAGTYEKSYSEPHEETVY